MTIMAEYDAAIVRGEINDDLLQREILLHMERLATDLQKANASWLARFRRAYVKGLYIYGPVGAGKTYLVDLFYEQVNEPKKARFHFHHFMQQVDMKLRRLQGKKDPLQQVAKEIAQSIRLLCFDEFFVHDVAFAMILAELLQALIAHGVVLVISSNTVPDELYKDGVHRKRFLPAIAAINQNCEVLNLNEKRDYRVGREPLVDAYLYPLNAQTQQLMESQFTKLAQSSHPREGGDPLPQQGDVPTAEIGSRLRGNDEECGNDNGGTISIQNRDIPYLKCSDKTIWFAFDVLCNLPRSQLDYLEIANKYDNIFLSDVPVLTEKHTLQAIMLIHFIDVMYDRGINVIISAAVPVDELYLTGEVAETFKRTLSRLKEMQSVDYLSRHPKREVLEMV